MTVTVSPETFSFVNFDTALIQRTAEGIAAALSIDRPIHVEVDETTPLARVRVEIGDSIVIRVESGAFEDTRRPRDQSEAATATALGRALLRANDRLAGGFGEAPADDDLSLAEVAAWETYCTGRLQKLGIDQNLQRWRYNFRNRHGFADAVDEAFDQLWSSDGLTWGEVSAISAAARLTGAAA
jgi:hypothetical protein